MHHTQDEVIVFSGLLSSLIPRFRRDMQDIERRLDNLLPDNQATTKFRIWNTWRKPLDRLTKAHSQGSLGKVVLIGHSNGVYASLKIAQALAKAGITIDLLISIDCTLKPCPPAGANVKHLVDFHAVLRYVKTTGDFNGTHEVHETSTGHVGAARAPWVKSKIIDYVRKVLR